MVAAIVFATGIETAAWHNGIKSATPNGPKFGGHDYIAYQAYVLAGKPAWLTANMNVFLTGTAAPDTAVTKPAGAVGRYQDTSPCHCILFNARGDVVDDRMAVRATQEFTKASAALAGNRQRLAAFYAGAMAHYIGDLSQFCHLMDRRSHWGAENQMFHAAYEDAVDKTFDPIAHTSMLLDRFVREASVPGNSPNAIALAVARFTEKGNDGRDPGWMNTKMKAYARMRILRRSEDWQDDFTEQTGQNVNYAINGVAKLLGMLKDD
jgi:zinc dependent phospholipase C